ncbi:MAG: transcription termination factor Rho [Pseudomonadota bacterium]|jgi:transcription termination factor Rho
MTLDLGAMRRSSLADLVKAARERHIENPQGLRKPELVAALLRDHAGPLLGTGLLEILADGFGFLRAPEYAFAPAPDDVYVSPSQIRRFNLRDGDLVEGQTRAPRESERYFALVKVETVNGLDAEAARDKPLFDNLVPVWPQRRFDLGGDALVRDIDALVPVAFGHRAIVVGPPRSGRTRVLAGIAQAVADAHPDVTIVTALLGVRPEDAAELQRTLPGLVVATTFEEPDARHVQVAHMVLARARRLVELGGDVLLLVDSLGQLARAAHATLGAPGATGGGRTLPGGLDVGAVHEVRRLLGAARSIDGGGSLTVLGSLDAFDTSPDAATLLSELRGHATLELHLAPREDGSIGLDAARSRILRADRLADAPATAARAVQAARRA